MARRDIMAGRAFVELYTKNSKFQRGLNDARQQLRNFGADISAMGQALVTASAAMLIPIGLATQRFADFDDKMREVKAVSQSTGEEFVRLTAKAKALGASTSFTAVQVGGLMAELGRAGFTADQIEKMTGSVLDLARATSTDATLASGIMAASIRQFGLEAADAVRVSDALTVAANKSFNSVETLGESLSYAGPVAADFNMSIEETLAILGALGNVGIQGSNAGTALRRLLTITGAEAKKLNDIFGVEFLDAAQNARPLVDVLEDVNEATKDLGTGARAQKFNEAFGLLGITGASAISKNTVSVRELMTALDDAEGTAARTAKEMDAGLGGTLRILYSAIEGVAIGIGDALAPELQKLGAWVTELAGDMLAWITANKETIVTMVKVAAGVGAVGAALVALGAIASGAAMALGLIAALASPIGLVVIALTALVGTAAGIAYLSKVTYELADAKAKLREEGDALRASDLESFKRLQQLQSQQSLTSQEMLEAGKIIDDLQETYGDLGLSINSATGEIEGMARAQQALNEAMAKKALGELQDEMHEAENNARKLREEFNKQQGFWRAWWREMNTAAGESDGMEGLLNDLTQAELKAGRLRDRFNEVQAAMGAEGDITANQPAFEQAVTGMAPGADEPAAGPAESTATRIVEDQAAIEEAQKKAEERQKRLDDIEEQIAARRRSRHEQEIYEIQQIAKERKKLLDEQGGGAAEYLQIEADAAFDIAEARRKHQEELAKEEERKAQEKAKSARDAQAEIDALKIDLDKSLTDQQKELAKLEIERKKALAEAQASGGDIGQVNEAFDLRKQLLEQGDKGDSQQEVAGTFSAAAAEAMGQGGTAAEKQVKLLEDIRRFAKEQYEESKRHRREQAAFR